MEDRIAQFILEKTDTPKVEEVRALEEFVRGSGGFHGIGINRKMIMKLKIGP